MILIDGDACPNVNEMIEICKKYNEKITIYADITHNISSTYATIKFLDKHSQSVDVAITNEVKNDDLIVTNDYGLAAVTLPKTHYVCNTKGEYFTKNNIDMLLSIRYDNQKLRKQGIRTKGPKKRTKEDVLKLLKTVEEYIKNK